MIFSTISSYLSIFKEAITLDIFNISTFFGTAEETNEIKLINFDNAWDINLINFDNHIYPNRDFYLLMLQSTLLADF